MGWVVPQASAGAVEAGARNHACTKGLTTTAAAIVATAVIAAPRIALLDPAPDRPGRALDVFGGFGEEGWAPGGGHPGGAALGEGGGAVQLRDERRLGG